MAIEANYMFGYSLYMQSPEFNLDQSPSNQAINVMQNFINQYPSSKFAENAGKIVNELELKLSLIHSDAADDLLCVDLGGRRIIKKK